VRVHKYLALTVRSVVPVKLSNRVGLLSEHTLRAQQCLQQCL